MSEPVISKELEKKLIQEYGRLSFRDKLMLIYAVSEATQQLKDKIEDIKANCDFAIEGRDIKIDELEEKNSQMFNTIALQEQQIEKMKCCENCKYKDCNKTSQYQTCWYCKNKDKWELKE